MSAPDENAGLEVGESEDLFDFASTGQGPAAIDADELDVDAFLSAVGDLAEEEAEDTGDELGLDIADDLAASVIGEKKSDAASEASGDSETVSPAPTQDADRRVPTGSFAFDPSMPLRIGLTWPVIVGGALLIAVNAWLVFTLWSGQARSEAKLESSRQELEAAAQEMVDRFDLEATRIERAAVPNVSPVLDTTTSLSHVERSLELGDHALARRQVYSLLSIIDRLPDERREDTEARAQFLLARIDRLEADASRDDQPARSALEAGR